MVKTSDQEALQTTATVEGESHNGWYTSAVQVTLNAVDEQSVVEATYYQINRGDTFTGTQLLLNEEGEHTVTYWSVDAAGNKETEQSLTVPIDLAPPTVDIQGQTEYTIDQRVEITYTASDTASGVDKPSGVLLNVPAYTLGPGPHQVTGAVYNAAGREKSVSFSFVVTATFDSLVELTRGFAAESQYPNAKEIAQQLVAR